MNAREIHQQAEQARERGKFYQALSLTEDAFRAYGKENDRAGSAEVMASQSLTFRHLAREENNNDYLLRARSSAQLGVIIGQDSGDKTAVAIPLYALAKTKEDLGQLQNAVATYTQALEHMRQNPPQSHDRPSVLADITVHLTTAQYQAGDKSALERAERAIEDLEKSDEEKYAKDVWLSGAHMRLAKMLQKDNPQKSKEHLQKAKEIIDANPELVLRKRQLDKLETSLK